MFKKNKFEKAENPVFLKNEIDFVDFRTYCCNAVANGDWVISLSNGDDFSIKEKEQEKDDAEFANTYDDELVKLYRRQDESIVVKNIKIISGGRPSNKGLYGKIDKILDRLDESVKKVPGKKLEKVCDVLRKHYDANIKDSLGQSVETHIWVPLWRTHSEKALLVTILGRINIVIT